MESKRLTQLFVGKRLWLHIGLHKTGTSAIQHFLRKNRRRLLREGVCFPQEGDNGTSAHSLLVQDLVAPSENMPNHSVWREIAASRCNTTLLSSEAFSSISIQSIRNLAENLVRKLGFGVKVVVYLRRQDEWLESVYKQTIIYAKRRETRPFPDNVSELTQPDYFEFLRPWSQYYGKGNIVVRPYEKEQFVNGTLIDDFLHTVQISLPYNPGVTSSDLINPSLSNEAAVILRELNKYDLDLRVRRRLIDYVLKSVHCGNRRTSFLPYARRKQIMAEFFESNQKVARVYLGRENGRLFMKDTPEREPAFHAPEEHALPTAIEIIYRLVRQYCVFPDRPLNQ